MTSEREPRPPVMFPVRPAVPTDLPSLAPLLFALWPDSPATAHAADIAPILSGTFPGALPEAVFVVDHLARDGRLVGFVQVSLRSHADGCDASHPVGYLEGWYVEPAFRRQGVGASLVHTAEAWSRSHGCREMASDTWLDHDVSHQAHAALGFEVVDRCVHFRKTLE
jgi:aminoglycoside 6'-N-acetyltransferase I